MPIRVALFNFPRGAREAAVDQVALNATQPTLIVPSTRDRRSVTVKNLDTAIVIHLVNRTDASTSHSFPLKAGESISVDTRGPLWGLAASGTPSVAFIETKD